MSHSSKCIIFEAASLYFSSIDSIRYAHLGHRQGQQDGSRDLGDKIGLLPDLS
jgi:hypothetical protein